MFKKLTKQNLLDIALVIWTAITIGVFLDVMLSL